MVTLEHLARALAVAAGDQGRVYVDKAPCSCMNRCTACAAMERTRNAHWNRFARGPQVLDGAQVFQGMPLLLQRIIRWGSRPTTSSSLRLEFKGLGHVWREGQGALHAKGRAHAHGAHAIAIIGNARLLSHDLQVLEERAVVQFNERKVLRFPRGAHPAADFHARQVRLRRAAIQFPDRHAHSSIFSYFAIFACGRGSEPIPPARLRRATSL